LTTPSHLLLIDDLDALRTKLGRAHGSLAAKWRHFQMLARYQSDALPFYPAFVGLVDGDGESVRRFRALLEKKIDCWPAYNRTVHVQYHIWCSMMSFARWAVAYDWVADHPGMAGFDLEKTADTFLDATYGHAYPVMTAREPTADSQIVAMLLSAAMVGYVFGVKRATDPRARLLLDYALDRVHELTDCAEPWFVGEGSAYLEGVNVPVIGWWLALLHWLKIPVDAEKWLGCLRLGRGIISPSGLSLGWDHYGHQRSFAMSGLALLACETNDPAPLALIDRLNLWRGVDHGAWGEDSRLWTLVYWPDDAPDWPATAVSQEQALPGWMHPRIGGALGEPVAGLRFFQGWDVCCGQIAALGRTHADANAITLEMGGSPLLLDGVPLPDCHRFVFDPPAVFSAAELQELGHGCALMSQVHGRKMELADLIKGSAYGMLAGSNSLIINHEPWWFPRQRVEGRGTLWCALPGLKAVAADCAAHYAPRYPIRRVERLSLCVEGLYVLTLDQIEADAPVEITWQAYTRRNARVVDGRVDVATLEGPRLSIVPAQTNQLRVEDVEGFPRFPSAGSACVQWTQRLERGVMATLLWPGDDDRLGELGAEWEGGFLDTFDDAQPAAPPLAAPVVRGRLDEVTDALAAAAPERWRWLRCRGTAPVRADYLRWRVLNLDAVVYLNGQRQAARPEESRLLPWSLPVQAARLFELLAVTRSDRGRLLTEPGAFYRRTCPAVPTLQQEGENRWIVRAGNASHELRHAPGGETDAAWILHTQDRHIYLLNATSYCAGGVTPLRRARRVHACWDGHQWLTQTTELPNSDVETAALGGNSRHPQFDSSHCIPCAPADSPGRMVARALDGDDQEQLQAWLRHEDWRVRMAAAQRLGDLRGVCAAPALREAVRCELACGDLYPPVPESVSPTSWLEDMLSTGREVGVNRYRVAQACLIALGQLQDRESLPLAREILHDFRHFYPLHHRACILLGELGHAADIPLLERWSHSYETNTQAAARRALANLRRAGAAA